MKPRRIILPDWQVRAAHAGALKAISAPMDPQPPEGTEPRYGRVGDRHGAFFWHDFYPYPWQAGDVLWVAEAFAAWVDTLMSLRVGTLDPDDAIENEYVIYRHGHDDWGGIERDAHAGAGWVLYCPQHMPRELSRITLTVGDPSACRLLDATGEELLAEGYATESVCVGRVYPSGMAAKRYADRISLAPWDAHWPKHPSAGSPWRWRAPVAVEVTR